MPGYEEKERLFYVMEEVLADAVQCMMLHSTMLGVLAKQYEEGYKYPQTYRVKNNPPSYDWFLSSVLTAAIQYGYSWGPYRVVWICLCIWADDIATYISACTVNTLSVSSGVVMLQFMLLLATHTHVGCVQVQVEGYDSVLPIAQVILKVKDLPALTAAEDDSMNFFFMECTGERKHDVSKVEIENTAGVLRQIFQKTTIVVRGNVMDLPPPNVPRRVQVGWVV